MVKVKKPLHFCTPWPKLLQNPHKCKTNRKSAKQIVYTSRLHGKTSSNIHKAKCKTQTPKSAKEMNYTSRHHGHQSSKLKKIYAWNTAIRDEGKTQLAALGSGLINFGTSNLFSEKRKSTAKGITIKF